MAEDTALTPMAESLLIINGYSGQWSVVSGQWSEVRGQWSVIQPAVDDIQCFRIDDMHLRCVIQNN